MSVPEALYAIYPAFTAIYMPNFYNHRSFLCFLPSDIGKTMPYAGIAVQQDERGRLQLPVDHLSF
jgi:hypothetical protein